MSALLTSPYVAKLETLHLNNNAIDDEAVLALVETDALPHLKELILDQNEGITTKGRQALRSTSFHWSCN